MIKNEVWLNKDIRSLIIKSIRKISLEKKLKPTLKQEKRMSIVRQVDLEIDKARLYLEIPETLQELIDSWPEVIPFIPVFLTNPSKGIEL